MARYHIVSWLGIVATTLALDVSAVQVGSTSLDGVSMPDKVTVAGTPLVLNGIGLRTATIFSVHVYVAGLYVKTAAKDEEAVLATAGPKQLRMEFVREVGAEKIAGAWDDSFGERKEKFKDEIAKLKTLMPSVKKGDRMTYTFLPDAVEVAVNDEVKGKLPGGEFGNALLMTWIGPKPPTKDLKRGLLGEPNK